jgi:hypothetical protein
MCHALFRWLFSIFVFSLILISAFTPGATVERLDRYGGGVRPGFGGGGASDEGVDRLLLAGGVLGGVYLMIYIPRASQGSNDPDGEAGGITVLLFAPVAPRAACFGTRGIGFYPARRLFCCD